MGVAGLLSAVAALVVIGAALILLTKQLVANVNASSDSQFHSQNPSAIRRPIEICACPAGWLRASSVIQDDGFLCHAGRLHNSMALPDQGEQQ